MIQTREDSILKIRHRLVRDSRWAQGINDILQLRTIWISFSKLTLRRVVPTKHLIKSSHRCRLVVIPRDLCQWIHQHTFQHKLKDWFNSLNMCNQLTPMLPKQLQLSFKLHFPHKSFNQLKFNLKCSFSSPIPNTSKLLNRLAPAKCSRMSWWHNPWCKW